MAASWDVPLMHPVADVITKLTVGHCAADQLPG